MVLDEIQIERERVVRVTMNTVYKNRQICVTKIYRQFILMVQSKSLLFNS